MPFVCAVDLGITNLAVAWFNPKTKILLATLVDLGSKTQPENLPTTLLANLINEPRYADLFSDTDLILIERPLRAGRFNTTVSRNLWILYTTFTQHPKTSAISRGIDSQTFVPGVFMLNRMVRKDKKARTISLAMRIAEQLGENGVQTLNLMQILKKADDVADAILITVAFAARAKTEGAQALVEKALTLVGPR